MDDMRNTSAPLYGKAEPATTKTTMSVREMPARFSALAKQTAIGCFIRISLKSF